MNVPSPALLRARWFDGRSSQAQPVLVGLSPGAGGPRLTVHRLATPGEAALTRQAHEVGWPERFSARRPPPHLTVDLGEHGSLEVPDAAGWRAALAAAGGRPSLADRMQARWTVLVAVLLVAAAGLWTFYRWGTPWAATQLTRQVPIAWELALSERALRDLDGRLLKPSQLPPERQAQLRERFGALVRALAPELRRYPGYAPRLQLQFRRGLGANALALPGGTIVMTDGLVEAAARHGLPDEALLGVLAHEIGHVVHRHTTRMLVEQAVLNVGLGLALGDVSWLLSTGSSLLTGLAYQRGHEGEADCFALALMRRTQLPTAPMGELLLRIDAASGGGEGSAASLLSTHPQTAERARRMKDGAPQGCR